MLSCEHQQDNYNYGRPAAVTTYDNKQYYQTSIATAQRTPTESYYQTGESFSFPVSKQCKMSWFLLLMDNNIRLVHVNQLISF